MAENVDGDRFAAVVGTFAALGALGVSLLPWTAATRVAGVENPLGILLALAALAVFGARAVGSADRRAGLAGAAVGGLVLLLALAALFVPAAGGRTPVDTGLGVLGGALAGFALLGAGLGDWFGLGYRALLARLGGVFAALLVAAVGLLVSGLVGLVVRSVTTGAGLAPVVDTSLSVLFGELGLLVVALGVVVARGDDVRFFDVARPSRREWGIAAVGAVVMLVALLGLSWLNSVLGLQGARHGLVAKGFENPTLFLAMIPLSLFVIAPCEELLNRNVVQKYLYEEFSRPGAVIVACLVFTAMHVFSYGGSGTVPLVVSLLNLFLISFVLGVSYAYTDNIVVPTVAHGVYNAVQFVVAYLMATGVL